MSETYLSPLRYPGGKARALSQIAPFFPSMDWVQEYREPFLGGGSVFLYLKEMYGPYYSRMLWWVNELEPYLYNFWEQLQKNPEGLSRVIEQYWNRSVSELRLTKQNMDLDNAAIYYVKNKSTFGGMALKSVVKGNYLKFKDSYVRNKERNNDKISMVSKLMCNTKITNFDYSVLLEEDLINDNTFVFLDPPYFTAKTLYGGTGKYNLHDIFDHYRFANIIKGIVNLKNVKFMITYDDCQTIRHLYSKIPGVKIIPFEIRYSIAMGSWSRDDPVGREIMITNYKTENVITKQTGLFDY